MKCGLCADACRIDGIRPAADYIFVESVLHKAAFLAAVPQAICVTLVLGEKRSRKLANRTCPGIQKYAAYHRVVGLTSIYVLCNGGFHSYVFIRQHADQLVVKSGRLLQVK